MCVSLSWGRAYLCTNIGHFIHIYFSRAQCLLKTNIARVSCWGWIEYRRRRGSKLEIRQIDFWDGAEMSRLARPVKHFEIIRILFCQNTRDVCIFQVSLDFNTHSDTGGEQELIWACWLPGGQTEHSQRENTSSFTPCWENENVLSSSTRFW